MFLPDHFSWMMKHLDLGSGWVQTCLHCVMTLLVKLALLSHFVIQNWTAWPSEHWEPVVVDIWVLPIPVVLLVVGQKYRRFNNWDTDAPGGGPAAWRYCCCCWGCSCCCWSNANINPSGVLLVVGWVLCPGYTNLWYMIL